MNQVQSSIKSPNAVIQRTRDLMRSLSDRTKSLIFSIDDKSLSESSASTNQVSEASKVGNLIEEWPGAAKEIMSRIDRNELKQAVKEANRDNMNRVGVFKDELDITFRGYRVRGPVLFNRDLNVPSGVPQDLRWSFATSKDTYGSGSTTSSHERQLSLDHECVTRSLKALNIPQDEVFSTIVSRETTNNGNKEKYMMSATSVLEFDNMMHRIG